MRQVQMIRGRVKGTLMFVSRHFFTLVVLGLVIDTFISSSVDFGGVFMLVAIAMLVDWAKSKIKIDRSPGRADERFSMTPTLQSQSPCNYQMVGTSTYLSSLGH